MPTNESPITGDSKHCDLFHKQMTLTEKILWTTNILIKKQKYFSNYLKFKGILLLYETCVRKI